VSDQTEKARATAGNRREETIDVIRRDGGRAKGGGASGGPADSLHGTGKVAHRSLPLNAIIGVSLVVLLFAVFFALPRFVGTRGEETPDVPSPVVTAAATTPALTAEELAQLRSQAEAALAEVLELDGHLRDRSADVWGSADFITFDTLAREGDDAFLADDFATANDRYASALELGRELVDQSDEIMSAALDAGDAAISAGNDTLAAQQYEIVLGVNPENARALAGLARAGNLPQVIGLTREGDRQRQAGELESARDSYQAALAIDGDWEPARRALGEVSSAIANARFDRRLSAGYAALADEDYSAALDEFAAALALRPNAAAALEGQSQAEQGQKLDAIALAEIRALAFERRELWDQAIERYAAALATDATLAFATSGLARAQARADLDRKLQNLIDNPRLLLDDEILADAQTILDDALAVTDPGARLSAQQDRLQALLKAASNPITVRLQSDQATQVTVYRVGTLGAFAEKEIELRPGTYTVVGSRNGYRDVRQTFTVLPGRPVETVSVVCVEPI
jgi:hypothetical protein